MTHEVIHNIPLGSLKSDNIRDSVNEEAVKGLAQSIKAVGQLYPVRVRREGQQFILVDGHRRTAAQRLLGARTIAAIIEGEAVTDAAAIQKAIVANAQRECVSPLATARAIARLMQEMNWSASEAASRLGFPASKVTKLLSYLKLPEELASQLSARGVGASVAYQLARIEDSAQQAQLAHQVLKGAITRDALGGELKRNRKSPSQVNGKPTTRATVLAGEGRSVSAAGPELCLESFIELLELVLKKARAARAQGLELGTFVRTVRDQSRSN
jgi:ParB family chromosome partitioning protein